MILSVDLGPDRASAALLGDAARGPVIVVARGGSLRSCLDRVLSAIGAGCVPGHCAELRVEWLDALLGAGATGSWPSELLDASGVWVAAPIAWESGADAGSSENGTSGFTVTEIEEQGLLLEPVTAPQRRTSMPVLSSFQSG